MQKKHIDDYLTEWLAGNDLAFNSIISHYYPRFMVASQNMLSSKEDAEELVMNVFLKMWQNKDQLSHVLKFDNYLFGILRQQIVRNARKNILNTVPIDDQILDKLGSVDHPEIHLQDLKMRYQVGLSKLHPKQREVFVYSRDHDMSQQEIAEKMGISVYTVNNHITSALKVLRQELKEVPEPLIIFLLTSTIVIQSFCSSL